jgi:hypothetical protein
VLTRDVFFTVAATVFALTVLVLDFAAFFTTGFFFVAVVPAAGVVAAFPDKSLASNLMPGQATQINNTANRYKVLLSRISSHSNHRPPERNTCPTPTGQTPHF